MSTPTAVQDATETVMLVQVSTSANNNKFYEATLHGDGTITKRWGRVGTDGQSQVVTGGVPAFEKLIASKERRGYSRVDRIGDPSRPSSLDLVDVARKRIVKDVKDTGLAKLVADWCRANRHDIETTSGGMMTVSDTGAVSTPLGLISASALADARQLLGQINHGGKVDVKVLERYLTLVPQKVGRTRGWEDQFSSADEIARQVTFLDQLDGSVAMAAATSAGTGVDAAFRYQLVRIDPSDPKFAKAQARFAETKNSMHTSAGLRLTGLFAFVPTDEAEAATWKGLADKLGNVRRLWHGTREGNLLSLLHRGYVVPKQHGGGTIAVTGRMFGDGVYFSDQSTKSLNYSQGYWGGGARTNHCFMLLNDVVMGKSYKPSAYGSAGIAASRNGYHSIDVKGGTAGVRNNEMVVWETAQIRPSYLCEFS